MNLVLRFECNNDDYVFNVILAGYEGYAVRHIVHIVQCIERVVVRYITVYPYIGRGFYWSNERVSVRKKGIPSPSTLVTKADFFLER
jgi:hypothetical protein